MSDRHERRARRACASETAETAKSMASRNESSMGRAPSKSGSLELASAVAHQIVDQTRERHPIEVDRRTIDRCDISARRLAARKSRDRSVPSCG